MAKRYKPDNHRVITTDNCEIITKLLARLVTLVNCLARLTG